MRQVQLEEQLQVGLEMLREAAAPMLRQLAPEHVKNLLTVFQDASAFCGASPGRADLDESVVRLR